MKSKSKEQYLLQKIAQGNYYAFWQLWLLYQDYLYRRCQMWMGGNQIDAEEVLSQARLKAWETLPNDALKITNPKAWLTRMTHHLCVDIYRKRQRLAKNVDKQIQEGQVILQKQLRNYISRRRSCRDYWSC